MISIGGCGGVKFSIRNENSSIRRMKAKQLVNLKRREIFSKWMMGSDVKNRLLCLSILFEEGIDVDDFSIDGDGGNDTPHNKWLIRLVLTTVGSEILRTGKVA